MHLHHGTWSVLYMMQSKAPEREILSSRRSFDCPRDAAWRRADCNSPIGRECWLRPVPEPEHIGRPQDHWTATHQSCRSPRSCQMPLPQRKSTRSSPVTGETRRMAAQERPCPTSGGGPVPLAAIQPQTGAERTQTETGHGRGVTRPSRPHLRRRLSMSLPPLFGRFASTTRETPGPNPPVSACLI